MSSTGETAEALAPATEQVLGRNPAVGEGQRPRVGCVPAHLPVRLGLLVARRPVGHDQVRDLLGPGARGDADDARDLGPCVGDELLGSVDHPLAVVELRPGTRVAGVRAGLGLGQAERAEHLAGAQPRQPLVLLGFGAVEVDRLGAERRVRAERDRDARIGPGQLLDRDRVLERGSARTADLLREGNPHPAELGHLRDDLVGERLCPVELRGGRRHFRRCELPDSALQQPGVIVEVEQHPRYYTD